MLVRVPGVFPLAAALLFARWEEAGEHLSRVALWANALEGRPDNSVLVDHVCYAGGEFDNQQVGYVDVVKTGDPHVAVDQKVKGQIFLVAEFAVGGGVVEADPEDDGVLFLEL